MHLPCCQLPRLNRSAGCSTRRAAQPQLLCRPALRQPQHARQARQRTAATPIVAGQPQAPPQMAPRWGCRLPCRQCKWHTAANARQSVKVIGGSRHVSETLRCTESCVDTFEVVRFCRCRRTCGIRDSSAVTHVCSQRLQDAGHGGRPLRLAAAATNCVPGRRGEQAGSARPEGDAFDCAPLQTSSVVTWLDSVCV